MHIGLCTLVSHNLGIVVFQWIKLDMLDIKLQSIQTLPQKKENSKFYKNTLPHDMIFTNEYDSISDEQV